MLLLVNVTREEEPREEKTLEKWVGRKGLFDSTVRCLRFVIAWNMGARLGQRVSGLGIIISTIRMDLIKGPKNVGREMIVSARPLI